MEKTSGSRRRRGGRGKGEGGGERVGGGEGEQDRQIDGTRTGGNLEEI